MRADFDVAVERLRRMRAAFLYRDANGGRERYATALRQLRRAHRRLVLLAIGVAFPGRPVLLAFDGDPYA